MLLDVLTRLSADTGADIVQKRSFLVALANQAAKDMYRYLECNKIYKEVTLAVQPNAVVSLPAFIGELRGMRMHTNELPFDINAIGSPRYVTTTLQYKFKNWRDLGESAVSVLPSIVGQLTFATSQVPVSPISITVNGQTNLATQIEEVVTLSGFSTLSQNLFGPQIYSIACLNQRSNDVTILDGNNNVLAILYNNQHKTRYKIVDVSQIFWTLDTNDGGSLIDVLYKVPMVDLFRDSDSFYAGDDYDEAWYTLAMHHYYRPIQNRQQDAATMKQTAFALLDAAKDSSESGIIKKLNYGRNKFYGIFRKYCYFPGSVTNVDHNIQS